MPRRTSTKKSFRYRRRYRRSYRKRFSRTGSRRQGKQGTKYLFNRMWSTNSTIGTGQVGEYQGSFFFKLSDLPNYTEFTGLFDQYKICAVKVTAMQPYADSATGISTNAAASNTLGGMPTIEMYSVVDYDDSSAINVAAMEQYQNCKIVNITGTSLKGGKYSRFFKPRIAVATFASGAFTSYSNTKGWIDCGYPDVQHYGFKWCFDPIYSDGSLAGTGLTWNVKCSIRWILKYYIAFRNVR